MLGCCLRCGRRGADRERARRNEETDARHRERLGLTQYRRATRRRASYRDRRRVGSWHLPRSRPLSNFRPCVARRPRTPAEKDERDKGPAKRTATTDAHGSTRPGRDARRRVGTTATTTTTPYDRSTEVPRPLSFPVCPSVSLRSAHVAQLIAAIYASERRAAAPVRTERSAVRIAPRTFTILVNTRVT